MSQDGTIGWTTFKGTFYVSLKGKWRANFFQNDHPIVLELGCGKGEYTVNLAQKFPEKNFVRSSEGYA